MCETDIDDCLHHASGNCDNCLKDKNMKKEKKRLGLFMDEDLLKHYEKECKKFNTKTGLDLTVNAFIVMALKKDIK
jgi:hypothetical protein